MDTTLREFHRKHRSYEKEAFLRKYKAPFLVEVSAPGGETQAPQFGTMVGLGAGLAGLEASSDEMVPGSRVFPLRKRGDVFPDKITVGRAPNNDVVLDDLTVSKLQAYFTFESDGVFLTDADSKNGSTVDQKRLLPLRKTAVPDGALVGFGPKLRFRYLTSERFYANMTSAMDG